MCLSMGSASNPLALCLVGILLKPKEYTFTRKELNLVDTWDEWMRILPIPEEPQELELLGSFKAIYCIKFYYRPSSKPWSASEYQKSICLKDVSPANKIYNSINWCNYTSNTLSVSSCHPRVLPQEVFLICRDRV